MALQRDPETGQFLAVEDDAEAYQSESRSWDDLEVQPVVIISKIDAADNSSGANGGLNSVHGLEPAEGLHRGEVAELVGFHLDVHSLWVRAAGGSGTTPGVVQSEYEFSAGPDGGDTVFQRDTDEEDKNNLVDVIGYRHEVNNSVYAKNFVHATQGFNDTTNGTGGLGNMGDDNGHVRINFRDEFGRGPVLGPTDTITFGHSLSTWEIANETVQDHMACRFVWDIYEESRLE